VSGFTAVSTTVYTAVLTPPAGSGTFTVDVYPGALHSASLPSGAGRLAATAGALLAQYQGFADVQMGIGMVVWGLASVIIGEALVGSAGLGVLLIGAVMGSVLFRLLVAMALRWGLNPNDLKLVTAAFVLLALVAPRWLRNWRRSSEQRSSSKPGGA
jgi:ABC-type uncharacterized transport system permease subunit